MVCDLGIACYVCWETIHTNPIGPHPSLFVKTYKNIYTTIHNDDANAFHNEYDRIRTYVRDGLACSVLIRIFTYTKLRSMEKYITHIEKYIQTPTLVIIVTYFMYHLIKACVG